MNKNLILFSLGILAVLLLAAFVQLKENALWGASVVSIFLHR